MATKLLYGNKDRYVERDLETGEVKGWWLVNIPSKGKETHANGQQVDVYRLGQNKICSPFPKADEATTRAWARHFCKYGSLPKDQNGDTAQPEAATGEAVATGKDREVASAG